MKTYEIGLLQSAAYRNLVRHTAAYLDTHNITPNQWAVLGMAYEKTPLQLTGIAESLAMRPASASELVNDLIQKKFLTRSENKKDRRVKDISLTQKGNDFLEKTEPKLSQHMQPLLEHANRKDISGYIKTLRSINGTFNSSN